MKYIFHLVLASFLVLSSCSKDNDTLVNKDFTSNDFPQTWKLIKMTGSVQGFESEGEDMDWQENYLFRSDGTFLKTRITEGESESASGSFIFDSQNQNFLLSYNQVNNITGSCSSDAKEHLYFPQNSLILLSNWWACDGPGLFYERIK